jgi:hypothetical protein
VALRRKKVIEKLIPISEVHMKPNIMFFSFLITAFLFSNLGSVSTVEARSFKDVQCGKNVIKLKFKNNGEVVKNIETS